VKRIGAWFAYKWKEKLISIVLAILLTVYVDNLRIGVVSLNLPVAYKNKPELLSFVNEPPRFLEIKFRGDKEKLNFPTAKLRIEVDLKNASPSRHIYPISIDSASFPETVELVDAPTQIVLNLQRTMQKLVLLRVTVTGSPEKGFHKGRVLISPDRAMIKGSPERLARIWQIDLPPIDVAAATENVQRTIPVHEPDGVQFLSPLEVEVTIQIHPDQEQARKAVELPVAIRGTAAGITASVQTKKARVTIEGDREAITELSPEDVELYVDLSGLELSGDSDTLTFDIPLRAQISRHKTRLAVVSVDPEYATVRFEKKK